MKNIKKVLCLVLALVMVAALGVSAWASTTNYTLSVSQTALDAGHTYVAYQIFDADPTDPVIDEETSSGLVETFKADTIKWGYSLDTEAKRLKFIQELNTRLGLTGDGAIPEDATGDDGAEVVAEKLSAMTNTANLADIIAEAAEAVPVASGDDSARTIDKEHTSRDLPTGYYFIKETSGRETKNIVYRHVTNETIESKIVANPNLDKQVETAHGSGQWADYADYSATKPSYKGDNEEGNEIAEAKSYVNFRIVATLPETFNSATANNYSMDILDIQNANFALDQESVQVYYVPDGLSLDNLKAEGVTLLKKGSTQVTGDYEFIPEYTEDGETYTFAIRFSELEDHSNPEYAAKGRFVVTYTSELTGNAGLMQKNDVYLKFDGDTIHDDVTVYTFELDIDKIDGETLTNSETGKKELLRGAEFTLYEWIGDANPTADTSKIDGNWKKVWTYNVPETDGKKDPTKGESSFKIEGLKEGKYKLVEDNTATGYNKLKEPIYLDVVAEYNKDELGSLKVIECYEDWTTKKENIPSGTETGVHVEVVNNKGVELPETGGIGTTIFYIGGAVLLLGAVVLLVTRRRAKFDED